MLGDCTQPSLSPHVEELRDRVRFRSSARHHVQGTRVPLIKVASGQSARASRAQVKETPLTRAGGQNWTLIIKRGLYVITGRRPSGDHIVSVFFSAAIVSTSFAASL